MKPLVFHPAAEEEAAAAAARYEELRAGLGGEFRIELEAALQWIKDNPQMFGVELGECRACTLQRFPYTIFYTDTADSVWIAAVAHQSRRPGYWARRHPS